MLILLLFYVTTSIVKHTQRGNHYRNVKDAVLDLGCHIQMYHNPLRNGHDPLRNSEILAH